MSADLVLHSSRVKELEPIVHFRIVNSAGERLTNPEVMKTKLKEESNLGNLISLKDQLWSSSEREIKIYCSNKDWRISDDSDALSHETQFKDIEPSPYLIENALFLVLPRSKSHPFRLTLPMLKSSFENDYCVPDIEELNAVTMLNDFIHRSISLWNGGKSKYLAPYTAMIQGSGSGKSRVAREIHFQNLVDVVYLCCRHMDIVAYPPRSRAFDIFSISFSLAKDATTAEALCKRFIDSLVAATYEVYANRGRPTDAVPLNETDQALFDYHFDLYFKASGRGTDPLLTFDYPKFINKLGKPFILVFDEARALIQLKVEREKQIDAFSVLYRVLYKSNWISKCPNFLVLGIDTLSTVSEMPPSLEYIENRYYSSRILQKLLLPPFYLLTNISVLALEPFNRPTIDDVIEIGDMKRFNELLNDKYRQFKLLTQGRPLWGSTFDSMYWAFRRWGSSVDEAIKLAADHVILMGELKLTTSIAYAAFRESPYLTSIACLGVLLGLRIDGNDPRAKRLVSSHGCWLFFVSQNSEWLQVGYLSELALVEEALKMQLTYLDKMLKALDEALEEKFVDVGTKGELIAAQLLLSARHAATGLQPNGEYDRSFYNISMVGSRVPLNIFLSQLGIRGVQEYENRLKRFYVNFTHFAHVFSTPTIKMMRAAAICGQAFVLQPGQSGAQLGVVYFDNDGEMGIIYFQVNNNRENTPERSYDYAVLQKMSLSYIYDNILPESGVCQKDYADSLTLNETLPHIGIYIQFGPGPRASMKRELVEIDSKSDKSLRACLMLHDDDALPCLKLYDDKIDYKRYFLQLAANQAIIRDWNRH